MEKNDKKSDVVSEIRALLDAGRLVFGSEQSLRKVRSGGIEKLFVSTIATPKALSFFSRQGVNIVSTGLSSVDLGVACKKPFSVSIVGVLSEKSD